MRACHSASDYFPYFKAVLVGIPLKTRNEATVTYYAGAATGLMFLSSIYLHELGIIDLAAGGPLTIVFVLLMFLPFVVFVARKSFVDFWTVVWLNEVERTSAVARATKRFWRFSGGLLLVFVPGSFFLFALLS